MHKNKDYFKDNISTLEPVNNAKCSMLVRLKREPSQQNLQALKDAYSKIHVAMQMTTGSKC